MKTYSAMIFINAKDVTEAERKVSILKDEKAVFLTKVRPWEKKHRSIWKRILFG
jgi:hypothetical protein